MRRGLVSGDGTRRYGVVLAGDGSVDASATTELRARLAAERGGTEVFVRGPSIDELRERCLEETGLPAPRPPVFRRVKQAPSSSGGSPAAVAAVAGS